MNNKEYKLFEKVAEKDLKLNKVRYNDKQQTRLRDYENKK